MHAPFYNTDPVADADPLSRAVVRLIMEFQPPGESESHAKCLATGSGIVIKHHSGPHYLVTAWHNLSGKDPVDKKPKRKKDGALPNWVRIEGFHFKHRSPLRDGDNQPGATTNPLYWVHRNAPEVDIAVLPLKGVANCQCEFGILSGGAGRNVRVADPVFVVGFPLGLVNQVDSNTPLPVWKIGNIANDPGPDFGGIPRFLIDATTLPGMSGSPVIVRWNYPGQPAYIFLGIYVGRYLVPRPKEEGEDVFSNEPRGESSALGWVIKKSVIEDIIQRGPVPVSDL